jgi:hypothetical protein
VSVLATAAALPPSVFLGFTAATGKQTDRHRISAVQISYP